MAVCVKPPVKSHGITDCFGLERSLQIIQSQPPLALFSSVPLLLNLLRVFAPSLMQTVSLDILHQVLNDGLVKSRSIFRNQLHALSLSKSVQRHQEC